MRGGAVMGPREDGRRAGTRHAGGGRCSRDARNPRDPRRSAGRHWRRGRSRRGGGGGTNGCRRRGPDGLDAGRLDARRLDLGRFDHRRHGYRRRGRHRGRLGRNRGGRRGTEEGGGGLHQLDHWRGLRLELRRLARRPLRGDLARRLDLLLGGRLALHGRGLGLGHALGLGLGGQLPAATELGAQLVRGGHVERSHGALALVAHAVQRQQQVLAGDAQLLREVNDLQPSRQSVSSFTRVPGRQHRFCALRRRLRRPPERVVEPPLPERAHQALEGRTRIGSPPRVRPARIPAPAPTPGKIQDRAPVSSPRQPDQLRLRPNPPTAQAGPTGRRFRHPASDRGTSSSAAARVRGRGLDHRLVGAELGRRDRRMLGHPVRRRLENGLRLLVSQPGYRFQRLEPGAHDPRGGVEARVRQAVHHLRADAGEAGDGLTSQHALLLVPAALLLHLALALDIDPHPGQLGGQARVLAALADGQRELVVGDDDEHRGLLALVHSLGHRHRGHLGRRQRACHEGGRLRRPLDDVDLLAAQLPADHLDPGAPQPHARADGIDITLGRRDRDLGALALPRARPRAPARCPPRSRESRPRRAAPGSRDGCARGGSGAPWPSS